MVRDARSLCSEIGLPENALDSVFASEGWQFFIQANALLEASINHALIARIRIDKGVGAADPAQVSAFVEKLSFGGRAGRVALLKLTELFPVPMLNQVEAFAHVRNAYAHDIRLVSKTCADLLRTLPEDRRRFIVDSIVSNPLKGQLMPDQDPVEMVEPVAHISLLALLAWVTHVKKPKGLLSLGLAAALPATEVKAE